MTNNSYINIRKITKNDFKQFWSTFKNIIEAQETYAFESNMTYNEAYNLWCEVPLETYVFESRNEILGTYYIKKNAQGAGSHICNCGYMVNEKARGRGIARKLCEHSQKIAIKHNFRAMQFNSVVSTNKVAIKLWKKLGFEILGTVPEAYNHKIFSYVDTYIMYKRLC